MEQRNQAEEQEQITDIALIEQDKSTVGVLQEDDLKSLREEADKVSKFKRKYTLKRLAIVDIENKDQKERLRVALADLRTTRVALKEKKTTVTKPYRDTVAYINSNYDKVIEAIESMEEPLIAHNKQIKFDIEAKEKEAENIKKQKTIERVRALGDAGCSFDGAYYSAGSEKLGIPEISLGIVDIESMTDGIFEKILIDVIQKVLEVLEKEAEENAKAAWAEKERLQKEAEEKKIFLEQQAKLKEEQEAIAKERAEFEKMKAEMQAEKDKIEADKQIQIKHKQKEESDRVAVILQSRGQELIALGFSAVNGGFICSYKDDSLSIPYTFIEDNDLWENQLETAKETAKLYNSYKIIDEKLFQERQAKELKERNAIISAKAIEDKRIYDEKVEQDRKDELAASKDSIKWGDFIKCLSAIEFPVMTSKKYKGAISLAALKIGEIKKLI